MVFERQPIRGSCCYSNDLLDLCSLLSRDSVRTAPSVAPDLSSLSTASSIKATSQPLVTTHQTARSQIAPKKLIRAKNWRSKVVM